MKILRQNWIQLDSLLKGHENLQKNNLTPLQSAQRGLRRNEGGAMTWKGGTSSSLLVVTWARVNVVEAH